jgi:hypothetical protein
MKKKYACIISLILCFVVQISNAQDINISNGKVFDGEPFIAINPINHQNIVVAWMGYEPGNGLLLSIKVKSSVDGGKNWSAAYSIPHMSANYKSADVSMKFDKNGNLFLCYIDYRESPDSGGVYVTESTNGGKNWSASVKAIDAYADGGKIPLDRPWFTSSDDGNNIYITTKPAPWVAAPNRPYFVYSNNRGKTWKPWRYIDSTNNFVGGLIDAPMATICYAGQSTIHMVYPSYLVSQSPFARFLLASSTNHGQNITYQEVIKNTVTYKNDSAKLGYKLIANPADSNHLVFVYIYAPSTDYDVMMVETKDGGKTWSKPLRINDDALGNKKMQDLCWAAFDSNGSLIVSWRDRRNGTGDGYAAAADIYFAYRNKDSLNFQSNIKLNSTLAAYNKILAQNGNDFMCIDIVNDTLYATWSDARGGTLDVWFVKMLANNGKVVGMSQINEEEQVLDIYPNPSHDRIYIQLKNKAIISTIVILDEQGKSFINIDVNQPQVDLNISELSTGIYILKIGSGERIYTQKILKQ